MSGKNVHLIKNYLLLSVSYNTCKWDYSEYNDFNSQWMSISYPSFSKASTIACFNKKQVSLYHITQLYRKVGMYLCHTEYQYPSSYKKCYQSRVVGLWLSWRIDGSLKCALPFTKSTPYNVQPNKWLHILLQPMISMGRFSKVLFTLSQQFSKCLVIGLATQCHWYCSHVYSSTQYGPDGQAQRHPGIRTSNWENEGQ
jgi:hypothetical protein